MMRTVTQQQIQALAPNANALTNARKISSSGGFVSRMRSVDDTFYMGECKGSGKSVYVVSADFAAGTEPVLRCSCPSRQFPCKHSLALLFEIAGQKEFAEGEIPEDILKKREKKEKRAAREEQAAAAGNQADQPEAGAKTAKSKASKAARTKKIKKQLEGLELTGQLVDQLMQAGLSTMGSVSLKTYRDLAKQLGDYYLPGPQKWLSRLIREIENYQKDRDPAHYTAAVEVLKRLHALVKKAKVYLTEKLEQDTPEADDDILYEELGGIWKLEGLNALGLKKECARLLQLSFQVVYDDAIREFTDLGWWMDVDTGEVFCTKNYRPVKAMKYIRQEDSCFALVHVPVMSRYPGSFNQRVRWDEAKLEEPGDAVLGQVRAMAHPELASAMKIVKNQIKNVLSEDFCAMLLAYQRIGRVEEETGPCVVLEDAAGKRLVLRNRSGETDTVGILSLLPDASLLEGQALFGLVYYDKTDHRMCMSPLSIVTGDRIVRLLY